MKSQFIEALLLGLSTGPVCLAYCAPVFAPLLVSDDGFKLKRTASLAGLFMAGRLAGYLAVGVVAGFAGSALLENGKGMPVAFITLLMGLSLIMFGVWKNFPELKLCKVWPGMGSSIGWAPILGLLTGINICPPFVAAIAGAAVTGSVASSLLYFVAFFAGTAVYVPPMLALGPLAKWEQSRTVARICLMLGGVWFLYKGVVLLLASTV